MLTDTMQRPMKDLRISVTDRCNFRCTYCMPFDEYEWIERKQVLSFEEIERLAVIFGELGVEKIRLTGGEPLVRRDLHLLVKGLTQAPRRKWLRRSWDFPDLTPSERVVFLFLSYHADEKGVTPPLSADEIGRGCNMGRGSVFMYLARLEERGFMRRQRQFGMDGGIAPSTFTLTPPTRGINPYATFDRSKHLPAFASFSR